MSSSARSAIVLLAGGIALLAAARVLTEAPGYRVPKDFPEYWAAGRLALRGENPYDPALLLREQQTVEPERAEPLMMWNPPPALALYLPLAVLPFRLAGLLWVGVQLLAVLFACDLLGRRYLPNGPRWLPPATGFLFAGTWWMVAFGQNSGLLLLGLAGFLYFALRRRPLAAGGFAALTALKPHLLAGFGVLLVADILSRRGRATLLAGVGVVAAALGAAVLADSNVIEQYLAATRDPGPNAKPLAAWAVPVPAYWLRMAVAPDRFWLQFLPCILACVGLVGWRFRTFRQWDWASAFPSVVALSVLSAPYGWIFDLPVLLVPVIWAVSRVASARRWVLVSAMLLGQIAILAVSLATAGALQENWWVAPAVLVLCLPAIWVGVNAHELDSVRPAHS